MIGRRADLRARFAGTHALVTGGSGGIGLAIAKRLTALGGSVTLIARDEGRLARAAGELGGRAHTLALDIADADAVAAVVPEELAQRPADLLVNCAGISTVGEFMEIEPDALRREMDVNYFGAVWMTRAAVPHLAARGRGHVLTVGSTASLIGIPGYGAYGPAKFALYGWSEVLRAELGPRGIGVTIVLPTSTRTAMLARELEEAPPETKRLIGSTRILEPDEVAETALRAVARGRFEAIPDRGVSLETRAYRALPWLGRRIVDRKARG